MIFSLSGAAWYASNHGEPPFTPPTLVVDIGANDGITLRCYPEDRYRVLGVEPSSAGQYARKEGFEIVDEFFNAETAASIAEG